MKKVLVFLLACLSSTWMFAAGEHYTVISTGCDPMNTKYNVVLAIDGEEQFNANLEIGAFDQDGICRGAKKCLLNPRTNRYVFQMQLKGVEGYTYYTFRVWDHENNCELPLINDFDETIGENGVVYYMGNVTEGTAMNPLTFNFTYTTEPIEECLDITGYASPEGNGNNWYLIASPLAQAIGADDVTNMTVDTFDLYSFDQQFPQEEWRNYKDATFEIAPCKGYLYARKYTGTICFSGLPYDGEGEVVLAKDDDAIWAGWNLLGNPYTEYITLDRDSYIMNEDGSEVIPNDEFSVDPLQGFFVIADYDGETITLGGNTGGGMEEDKKVVLNIGRGRGNVVDRAIVRFGEGRTLPKFTLNERSTKLYIKQGNEDFAVVRSDNQGEMPVNFSAAENGTYTLSVNTTNTEMNYLHLIDNMTGNDVNLLETPSYTFEAKTTDYASRFRLVFATGNSDEDNFAFFCNGNLVVSNDGNATLQVIDVNGRILSSESINGSASIRVNAAAGVYMIRLINGDNVKVQKVVVK